MKKTLNLVLLLILFSILPTIGITEKTVGLYSYNVKGNGTAIITRYDWNNSEGDVNVPNMIDGYLVTEIGEEAFARKWEDDGRWRNGVAVTLPDSIVAIGDKAFWGAVVNSINIPDGLKLIGSGALVTYTSSMKFSISPKHEVYTTIEGNLYNKVEKEFVVARSHAGWDDAYYDIPEGIVSIAPYAFYKSEIDRITIPTSLKRIGAYAFSGSGSPYTKTSKEGDKSFDFSNIIELGEGAFDGCRIFSFSQHQNNGITIPPSLKEIPDYAFANTYPYYIEYPENLITIGDYAFYNAYGLKEIRIPSTVKSVGEGAFKGIGGPKSIVIEEGVKTIGDMAFQGCYSVNSISIPKSITRIGDYAFSGMNNSVSIHISGESTEIGANAFSDCMSLNDVVIGDGVTKIGAKAFANCNQLTEVTISKDVKSIGNEAFDKSRVTLIVESGSYAELWAEENGCDYRYSEASSLDWLNN